MKKFYAKLKANLAKAAGLLMLLMAMMMPSGAWGQVTILSENFDGGETEFPTSNGWTTEVVEDWLFWEYSDGGNYNSCDGNRYPNAAYSGSYNASIQPLGYNTKMISPVLDLADYSEVTMSFMLAQPYIQYFDPDWGEYCYMHGNTVVSYKTNNSDEWVVITTITDILDSWTQKSVAIPTTATQIAFHYVKDGDMFGIVSIDDIVITGESGVTKYNINYATGLTGGSISGKTKAAEDEVVEVTVEPFEHWYFTNMTVTKTGESSTVVYTGSSNVFTMPAYDVDVTAIFAEKFYHYFTNNIPSSNADVRFEDYWGTEIYGAYVDDEVYVRITDKPGFELASLSYNSTPIDISSGTGLYSFTMPDADVTLTATFNTLQMYNISCSWVPMTCGTISCSETALPGSTVTITPNAYSGYMLAYYVVKGVTSGNVIDVNGNQFTMPNEDVTVKGVFAVATAQEVEVLHEGFNNATNPPYNSTSTGWTEDSGFGSTSWGYSTGSQYVGGRCAMQNVDTKKMVTPAMDLSDASSGRITFMLKDNYQVLYVHYRASSTSEWVELLKSSAQYCSSLTQRELILPSSALTATCQLGFSIDNIYGSYSGDGVWFDELYVYKTTSTPKYSITANAEHGDMYFNPSSPVAAGQTVTVNATASTGYRVTGITATNDVDGSPITVTENQFTMPNAPVTVTATYEEASMYTVTINKIGGGSSTVSVSENPATEGNTITIYVNEAEGYVLSSLEVTKTESGDPVAVNNYQFVMPSDPVTVNAEFAGMLEIGHIAATSKSIVIKMHDSYGDGWNGNYLTVSYNDGTSSENLQLSSGFDAQYTRTLNPGVTMTVAYQATGSWQSENSFTVEYQGGAMIYQSSGTPSTGTGCDITNPDNSTVWLPVHRDNYYSMSEMIYNHSNYSSLEGGIIVSKINFWTGLNNNSKTYNDVKVYMKTTSYNNFTETDHIAFTNADLVFNGSFTAPASNDAKIDLTLDTPFRLADINQNIVVGVYSEGNNPGSTYPVKFNSFAAENCGKQWNTWMSNIETYSFEDGSVCNDIPAFGLTYGPIPSHNISYMEATAQGSIGGPATATEGAVVTVYPYASSGYKVDVITVTKADESGTCEVNEDHQFTMPTCDVTVSATFTELQPLSITMPGTQDPNTPTMWLVDGGSIECYNTVEVYEGDNVYLTVYPDGANTIKSLTITDNVTEETVSYNLVYDGGSYISYQFTMPEHNATIALEFNIMVTVFSEDFETGYFASNKWENEGVWTCNYGGYDNIDGNIIPSAPNSGSYNALMYNGTDMKLSTKGINFADYENLELSFYYVRYAYNSYQQDYNKLRVYYKNASGSWTLIDDSECALANSWTKKTLDLSDITTSSQFQLAFEGSGSYWGNVTIDDIVVTGTLKPDYTITKADGITHGDITISAATAKQGQTITVTPAPEAGYKVSMISYTDENGWDQYIDMSKTPYTFSMPAANTTVNAEFVEKQYCDVTIHLNGLIYTETVEQLSYFTLPTVPTIQGYSLLGWANEDVDIQGTTDMPTIVAYSPYTTECQIPALSTYDIYAVYDKEGNSFKMVTGATTFNDGEKFIAVINKEGNYYYALTVDSYSSYIVKLDEGWNWISSDGVAQSLDYLAFTIEGNSTDGFTINKDGRHISPNGTEYESRYYMVEVEEQTQDLFKFTQSGSGYKISSNIGGTEYNLYRDGSSIIPMNGSWHAEFRILKEQQGGGYPIGQYYTYIADVPVSGDITLTGDVTVTDEQPFIIGPTAVVTVTGTLTNDDPANIIIQDGGELILAQGNTGVKATVEKSIAANGKGDPYTVTKWYTIGSSVNTPIINGSTGNYVANIIPASGMSDLTYNLYYLDMTKELPWINYRQEGGTPGFTTLENGLGYIYSNQAATTIEYVGELNTANVNRSVNEGWNLVSNPFAQTIAFNRFVLNSGSMAGYYSLDGTGGWQSTMLTADVKNNQGILVNVPAATTMTISRPQNDGSKGDEKVSEDIAYIEINVANANYSDRAYAAFTEGYGLPKYNHQNAEIQKIYIPQNSENFAIAMMDESVTMFPLNFKAMTTGYYTISLKSSQIYEGYNDFDYLHLIDNMTGEEIDMLLEDSYKFVGSPRDNEGRFTVKLHRNGIGENEAEDINFVYQNGNSLVINGEGTFQLIDMLGRVVISKEIHGETVSVDNLITGAYIVRMIGNEVKTQKIVIK